MRSLLRLSVSSRPTLPIKQAERSCPESAFLRPAALLLALIAGCGKGDSLSLPSDGEPATIVVARGDGQSGRVGEALTNPVIFQVTDSKDRPVEGATVTFELVAGGPGADVVPKEKGTDADGMADTRVMLGTSIGTQTGKARVTTGAGSKDVETTFTAIALSENANELAAVAGQDQTGPVGTALKKRLVVQVTDHFGNPVPDVPITWTTEGGGSVSSSPVNTDDQGKSSVDRTLGNTAGPQSTRASSQGLVGSPVTFNHMAVAGNAAGVSIVSGNNQSGAAGARLAQPLVVQLLDEAGNGVPGTAVTWVVATGGGSVSPVNGITDAAGRASAQWTLGDALGEQRVDGVVSGVGIGNFTATATPAPGSQPARMGGNGGDSQTGTVGTTLPIPLSVKVVTGDGGPAAGVTVTWAAGEGGSVSSPRSITNANGIAQVLRTLGPSPGVQTTTATVPGLAGSPVTFRSTASPGAPSALFLRTQPSENARNGIRFGRQPVVQIRDGSGNDVRQAGLEVTASIAEGGGTLGGTVRRTTDGSGRASFTDLFISGAPGRRTLIFSAANHLGATSNPIDLAATDTRTSITGDSPATSAVGEPVLVSFRVSSDGPVPTGKVTVSDGVDGCVGELANGSGSCSIALRTAGNRTLTARYVGAEGLSPSSGTAQHTVSVPAPANKPPKADFHWDCRGTLTCPFTDASSDSDGRVVSYAWDFGDGGTSDQKDPTHPYATAGTYNVTLTVRDDGGATGTTTAPVPITAPPTPRNQDPKAEFSSACPDLNCQFTDKSSDKDGRVTQWEWDFGDGKTSRDQSPSHKYATAATYKVTLKVTDDSDGTDAITHDAKPTAPAPPPPAGTETTITGHGPDPSVQGDGVTITFTVASQSGTPDGDVIVSSGSDTCTGTLTGTGSGSCTLTFTSSGSKTITAKYQGNSNFNGSTGTANHTVNPPPASTTTTITGDGLDPSDQGAPITVTFTVTASSGSPTGDVQVTEPNGGSCSASVAAGNCTLTPGGTGTRALKATYLGNSSFSGSWDTEDHTVNPPPPAETTTNITSDLSEPSIAGTAVIVAFTVSSSAGTPTGTVNVSDGIDSCPANLLDVDGSGICSLTLNTEGLRTVTATYAGNSSFKTSEAAVDHQVDPASVTP